jgi:hypothetical protein
MMLFFNFYMITESTTKTISDPVACLLKIDIKNLSKNVNSNDLYSPTSLTISTHTHLPLPSM